MFPHECASICRHILMKMTLYLWDESKQDIGQYHHWQFFKSLSDSKNFRFSLIAKLLAYENSKKKKNRIRPFVISVKRDRYYCEKYRNFTQFPGVEILWKGTAFRIVSGESRDQVKLRYLTQCKFKSYHHLNYTQILIIVAKIKLLPLVVDGLSCINSIFQC